MGEDQQVSVLTQGRTGERKKNGDKDVPPTGSSQPAGKVLPMEEGEGISTIQPPLSGGTDCSPFGTQGSPGKERRSLQGPSCYFTNGDPEIRDHLQITGKFSLGVKRKTQDLVLASRGKGRTMQSPRADSESNS